MSVASQRYRVLYFVRGHMPSAHQIADARQYGPHVSFRNVNFHTVGSGMEPCTAVAGEVPSDYRRKFPMAVPYMDWIEGKLPAVSGPLPKAYEGPSQLDIPMPARGGAPALPVPPPPPPVEGMDAGAAEGQEAPADFGLTPPPPSGEPMAPPAPPPPTGGRLSRRQQEAKDKGEGIWEDK